MVSARLYIGKAIAKKRPTEVPRLKTAKYPAGRCIWLPEQAAHRTHLLWDSIDIYQHFKDHAPSFEIGTLAPLPSPTYTNPIKIALQYKSMLGQGLVKSQADLARHLGVSRAKVTQVLNLLKLPHEIRDFIANLDETDARLRHITERRLRPLMQCRDDREQIQRFAETVSGLGVPHHMSSGTDFQGK